MFRKAYKIKTSTTVKGSDRRRLRNLIEMHYSSISTENLNTLVPSKSEMTQTKAMTHNGTAIMIYCSSNTPVFFQVEERCYPTIYTVWKYPGLLPTVVTLPPVLEKLLNGADLMAPGVVINESTIPELRQLKRNDVCSIRIIGNKTPIAIGKAVMSQEELCTEGIKGKAVIVIHTWQDFLWLSGNQENPSAVAEDMQNTCSSDDLNNFIDEAIVTDNSNTETVVQDLNELVLDNKEVESEACTNDSSTYTMDDILTQAFMTAIKTQSKKITLPLLTSTFYSSYVLKCCPRGLNLDIKKTTYKKLSVFLKKMQKEGLVQVKELTKGQDSIISINTESEKVKLFSMDPLFQNHIETQKNVKVPEQNTGVEVQCSYKFPSVVELFVVSAQVKALFDFSHIRKGETVPGSTVRDVIKQYVKENSLQSENNPRQVTLDPVLADCVLKKGENKINMQWVELYDAVVSKMPSAYQVTFEGKDPMIKKGKLEPIDVTVDIRTGNKKVTLIQNLETYGIQPDKLAQHVQVAVAASTSIGTTQNGKGSVVLIQGNQVRYLQKLFLDVYKVPRKHLKGLENVPSKKK